METAPEPEVIIVGAGLAGLTCGTLLSEAGKRILILEASDRVGGRVATDVVDGFRLDHGFQVLLTAYPACREMLDYEALKLRKFEPGALIRSGGKFTLLGDPWRRPAQAIATALNPVGSIADKLRIAKLRRDAQAGSLTDLYSRPGCETETYLRGRGFSERMIDQFFRPFIGGVFLDESLQVSSRMLEFVFRMFSEGEIAVPADGMGAIPSQLAQRIGEDKIRMKCTATDIRSQQVHLSDGTAVGAPKIVVATESNSAAKLLGIPEMQTSWGATTTIYYSCTKTPDNRKLLILGGDESGPIQTATVMSNVAPEYAPRGESLISISLAVNGEPEKDFDAVDRDVRQQLESWFGPSVNQWQTLGSYRIPYGVPQSSLDPIHRSLRATDYGGPTDVWICGDHMETPSIQGAMNSGIRVAKEILGST